MKKRIPVVVLVMILCIICSIPAFADTTHRYTYDDTNTLTADQLSALDAKAEEIYNQCGIAPYFVMVHETGELDAAQYAEKCYEDYGMESQSVILLVTDELYYFLPSGDANSILSYDAEDTLWSAFRAHDEYYDAVAAYIDSVKQVVNEYYTDLNTNTVTDNNIGKRMVDNADILDSIAETEMSLKLDEISSEHQFDVIVVTIPSLYGMDAQYYADEYYDFNGYGFGENYDGILFLLSMQDREWAISTCGYGQEAFTDDGLEYMEKKIVPSLRKGDYAAAFNEYMLLCDEVLTQAENGVILDSSNLPKTYFSSQWVIVAVIIGVVVAVVVTLAMKGQLKSVKKKDRASDYMKANSLNVTESRERFLFSNVTRRAKPKNNSGSGGRSSSGRSHGGRSGRF